MPYGDDITEGLPFVLSNPSGNINYTATGYAYDIAIAGLPFFISPLDFKTCIQKSKIKHIKHKNKNSTS